MALAYLVFTLPSLPKINAERPQTGKLERWINIPLQNIKREVVEAAKTPDCDEEQERATEREVLAQQNRRGDGARKQE